MKLYLSSYRLGNYPDKLQTLVKKSAARVAVSVNAADHAPAEIRNERLLQRELGDMQSLGFDAQELDLRVYFGKDGLLEHMQAFDLVWVSGGNVFLLVKAMKHSGFDKVLQELVKTDRLVYAGYSAAFCALSPSLHGMECVDNKDAQAEGYAAEILWDGYGLIPFFPIVHFRSHHHESALVEEEYAYVLAHNIPHKTFRDGDVYVVEGTKEYIFTA
jgi:dipeptidase E